MTDRPQYRKIDSFKTRESSPEHSAATGGEIPIHGSSRYGKFTSPMRAANCLIGVLIIWLLFALWSSGLIHRMMPSLWNIPSSHALDYIVLNLYLLVTFSFYGSLIWWTLRVARNSRTVHQRPRYPTIRPGRIAISWIIPFVGGFIPFYTLNKVRKESLMKSGGKLLFIWWIGWGVWPLIALLLIPGSSFFLYDLFSNRLFLALDWIGWGIGMLSTIAGIIFIATLSKHQGRMRPR